MKCVIISSGEELLLNEDGRKKLRRRLSRILAALYLMDVTDFYLTGSNGVPLWAAEMICEDKQRIPIRLHIIATHEEQATDWSEEHRELYFRTLAQADSIQYAGHPDDAACSQRADEMLLAQAQLLVDCKHADSSLYITEYARQHKIPIHFLP